MSGEFPEDIVLFSWGSHRLPLVMWALGGMRAQETPMKRACKGRKGTNKTARGTASESSEVSKDGSLRESAPSASESADPEHQNG
ncbi:hypothetical protein KH5H1_40470 [Corallococcus caeni]|nr:hypothetical protein KH5H1_40470 [Corallococcus sp. KH5-1]